MRQYLMQPTKSNGAQAPQIINPGAVGTELGEMKSLARVFIDSGLFADTRSESQAVVKIMAGKEMGLTPFVAMRDIYIIQGKVALSSSQIAAKIKQAGYNYNVKRFDDEACIVEFVEGEKTLEPVIEFNISHATKMGLAGKDNYKKQARTMLFWRAVTMGARMHCPQVFNGAVYTPEELEEEKELAIEETIATSEAYQVPSPVIEQNLNQGGTWEVVEPVTQQELPEPLGNPWFHVIEGNNKMQGKCLVDIAIPMLEKIDKPAHWAKLTPKDLSNIRAAIKAPELRDQAAEEIAAVTPLTQLEFEEVE